MTVNEYEVSLGDDGYVLKLIVFVYYLTMPPNH